MKKVKLIFPSIIELVDFQIMVRTARFEINRTHLFLIGLFGEPDIEMATRGFGAKVEEEEYILGEMNGLNDAGRGKLQH